MPCPVSAAVAFLAGAAFFFPAVAFLAGAAFFFPAVAFLAGAAFFFTAVVFLAGAAFFFSALRFLAMSAPLGQLDVFRARAFRSVALFEGHGLSFPEVVELHAVAGGLVEEVLGAFFRRYEPKAFVTQ